MTTEDKDHFHSFKYKLCFLLFVILPEAVSYFFKIFLLHIAKTGLEI